MRTAEYRIKSFLCALFICAAGTLFFSCGLDTVIYVYAPETTYNSVTYESDDSLTWYSSFLTKETEQEDSFSGTEVYYKIYNNYSDLTTQRNAILSVNSSSNSSSAATRLIETYTYQPLGILNLSRGNFIPANGDDKTVTFRIKTTTGSEDYQGDNFETFRACLKYSNNIMGTVAGVSGIVYLKYVTYTVTVNVTDEEGNPIYEDDGTTPKTEDKTVSVWKYSDNYHTNISKDNGTECDYSDITFYVPCRVTIGGNKMSFDFFDDEETDSDTHAEPAEGDADYYYNSTASASDTYYVQFFAVGVAFDSVNLKNAYSLVLDLGSVPVIKGR